MKKILIIFLFLFDVILVLVKYVVYYVGYELVICYYGDVCGD